MWLTHILSTEVCISTQDWRGVEIKSMIDLVLVETDMLRYVQDVCEGSERDGT